MKRLSIALCAAIAALWIGTSASAETINYTVSGWQTTCWSATYTGIQGDCVYNGWSQEPISVGTITGTAQFVGDSVSGGMLTVTSSAYVTSGYSIPTTFSIVGRWYSLSQLAAPAGLTVTAEDAGTTTCTPTSSYLCTFASTTLPVANINIYGPGNTLGGTLSYMVNAVGGISDYPAWQSHTLTVVPTPEQAIPEPSAIIVFGFGALLIGTVTQRKKR